MQDSLAPRPGQSDEHLLFGALALQAELLDARRFAEACATWKNGRWARFADLLTERGWLTPIGRHEVERLAERKLRKHQGNVQAVLDELAGDSLQQALVAAGYHRHKCTTTTPEAERPLLAGRRPLWTLGLPQLTRSCSPVNLAAVVVAVALAGLTLAMFLFPTSKMQQENVPAEPAAESRQPAPTEEDDPEPAKDPFVFSYLASLKEARRAWQEGNVDYARQQLEEQRPRWAHDRDLRGFEWYFLRRLCQEERLILQGHTGSIPGYIHGVAFSPDGSRLAGGVTNGGARIWDAATGEEVLRLRGHGAGLREVRTRQVTSSCISFSPDGRRLASGSAYGAVHEGDGTLNVWDLPTGKLVLSINAPSQCSVVFSPDGRQLASANNDHLSSNDQKLCLWDATSGKCIHRLQGQRGVNRLAYSPDGRYLAAACDHGTVEIWHVATGEQSLSLEGHKGNVLGVTYSPDGQRLATLGEDQTVRVWDMGTGKEILRLSGHGSHVRSVAYSPDGRRLATAGMDGNVRLWEALSGKELFAFKGSPFNDVTFSPDGQRLAASSLDGSVQIWEASFPAPEVLQRREAVELVEPLFATLGDKYDVAERLRQDATLSESRRKEALAIAERHREDPLWLNNTSWYLVREPNRSTAEYRRALRQAEEACRQEPDNGYYLNTLGVAQYRLGLYAEALATLTRSDEINSAQQGGPILADVAFLVMIHLHLGKQDQAEAALGRLREALQRLRGRIEPESRVFVQEVESLLAESKAKKPRLKK